MEDLQKKFTKLASDISSLPEREMRLSHLKTYLRTLDEESIAKLFAKLYDKDTKHRGTAILKGLLVSPEGLVDALGDEKYKMTYLASLELKLEKVSRLFTDLPPHKQGMHGYSEEEEAKMEFVTLGERRAMAKTNVKDKLDRLLSDPDVMVINNLLNNPRLTEIEVLKIASKRPNSPKTLKTLATHRKWSKRYSVMKSLVMNPYTPPRISTGFLSFLLLQDLVEVVDNTTLHPQVRAGAEELIEEKRAG